MRNYHQTIFQIDCTILYSHPQCVKAPISPYPHQHVILCLFVCLFSFDSGHTAGYAVVFQCDFNLHFSDSWCCWADFTYLLLICVSFFNINVCSAPLPIFNSGRPKQSSWPSASAWPSLSCCGHLENKLNSVSLFSITLPFK